ncbi:hypothetical protein XENTR_v10003116 [Xenopus tropicalis]|nr:hypothetical protein XENTR_v10003116 [Xenopus tropicalis]
MDNKGTNIKVREEQALDALGSDPNSHRLSRKLRNKALSLESNGLTPAATVTGQSHVLGYTANLIVGHSFTVATNKTPARKMEPAQ